MLWKIVSLIAILLFWVSLGILLVRWPRVRNKSISQHSASLKEAYIFFTTSQVVIGFILYVFMIEWFIPTFHLSLTFTVVYTITAWLQIMSAFISDMVIGLKSKIHQTLANPFAVGMLVSSLLLSAAPHIHGIPKLLCILSVLYMAYCIALLLVKKGRVEALPNYLTLQVIYIVIFQVSILSVTFFK